jgi:hypothetical protein
MLARKDGISSDSISIKTLDFSSEDTLTLASKSEGSADDEESVLRGFSATLTDLATLYEEERFLTLSAEPISVFFRPVPFFSNDSRILAVQFLAFDTISPSCDFVVTFRAMPYPYDDSMKLQ